MVGGDDWQFFRGINLLEFFFFFFSSRRRHTRLTCDWSSDVCSSDLLAVVVAEDIYHIRIAIVSLHACPEPRRILGDCHPPSVMVGNMPNDLEFPEHYRSEERRVGKECRSRWSPDH